MSTILKRFEIWILFAIVAAGVWWAFQAETVNDIAATDLPENTGGIDAPENDPESAESAGLLEIKNVNLTSTVQGTVVELTLFGKSGTDEAVALGNDTLELLTSEGEDVHRFFLPFDPDPMLAPDEKSLVTLKYWLKSPVDVLWLTYRDQTVKVDIPTATI